MPRSLEPHSGFEPRKVVDSEGFCFRYTICIENKMGRVIGLATNL